MKHRCVEISHYDEEFKGSLDHNSNTVVDLMFFFFSRSCESVGIVSFRELLIPTI